VPKKRKPVYNGAFLEEDESFWLWVWLEKLPWAGRPKFLDETDRWYCHHMTHAFKPRGEQLNLPYGEEVKLQVLGISYSDECVALIVKPPFEGGKAVSHITIWCAEGVAPKYSNQQIDEKGYWELDTNFKVKARVGYFDGKEVIYSAPE